MLAIIFTNNSGVDVRYATTVNLMVKLETVNLLAIDDALQ
jgi:hypothetical protein